MHFIRFTKRKRSYFCFGSTRSVRKASFCKQVLWFAASLSYDGAAQSGPMVSILGYQERIVSYMVILCSLHLLTSSI